MLALRRACLMVPLVAVCAACGTFGPGDCVAIGRFGLNVVVRDSATGGLPAVETRVIARDGEYADTAGVGAPSPSGSAFSLAPERPGSFLVTVESQGYRDWSKPGVVVTRSSGKCQELQTVSLLARLQR
jgi:hypothetical protein